MGDGGLTFLYAFKLRYRIERADHLSEDSGPLCGIYTRTLSSVEGKIARTGVLMERSAFDLAP